MLSSLNAGIKISLRNNGQFLLRALEVSIFVTKSADEFAFEGCQYEAHYRYLAGIKERVCLKLNLQ
jgi:hypothetical protein